MPKKSLSELSELTGFDRRKVSRRLETLKPTKRGRSHLYDSPQALRLLYGDSAADGKLDPQQERAALDRARRESVEADNKKKAGELIHVEEVTAEWVKLLGIFKARLMALPMRLAPELLAASDLRTTENIVKSGIVEALEELSRTSERSE